MPPPATLRPFLLLFTALLPSQLPPAPLRHRRQLRRAPQQRPQAPGPESRRQSKPAADRKLLYARRAAAAGLEKVDLLKHEAQLAVEQAAVLAWSGGRVGWGAWAVGGG
jgi:hypothetical protein